MKNVLFIAGKLGITDGAFRSLFTNLGQFQSMDIRPIVIVNSHGPVESSIRKLGIKCIVVPFQSCVISTKRNNIVKKIAKIAINIIAERVVYKIICKNRIDLVHINVSTTSLGAASAIKLGVPLVWHLREFLEDDLNLTYIQPKHTAALLKKSNCVIAVSCAVAKHFREKYQLRDIHVIYNAVYAQDIAEIRGMQVNRPESLDHDKVFSIIGRITGGKGQFDAVRAIKLLNMRNIPCRLQLIGNIEDTSYFSKICTYVQDNQLDSIVNFIPPMKDLEEIWKYTDVGLVCSQREGFGRVTAEFMLHGIPVIGSDTGATVELLAEDRGILYKNRDIDDLADKMQWTISAQTQLPDITDKAFKFAKKEFEARYCAQQIFDLYQQTFESPISENGLLQRRN